MVTATANVTQRDKDIYDNKVNRIEGESDIVVLRKYTWRLFIDYYLQGDDKFALREAVYKMSIRAEQHKVNALSVDQCLEYWPPSKFEWELIEARVLEDI